MGVFACTSNLSKQHTMSSRFLLLLVGLAALAYAKSYNEKGRFFIKALQEKQDSCKFKCSDTEFIDIAFRCNDYPDCFEGNDEEDCENYTYDSSSGCAFECALGDVIPFDWLCDDYPDCRGNTTGLPCAHPDDCMAMYELYGEDEKSPNCPKGVPEKKRYAKGRH